MDTKRLILFVVLSFSILLLWGQWQSKQHPQTTSTTEQVAQTAKQTVPTSFNLTKGERVTLQSDVLKLSLDLSGGDIRYVELLTHKDADDVSKNLVLLDDSSRDKVYTSQSGLLGEGLPSHKAVYQSEQKAYQLKPQENSLTATISFKNEQVKVDKTYTLMRGDYAVKVDFAVTNLTDKAIPAWVYYQIVHDSLSDQGTKMMPTYTGGAYFNNEGKYKKVAFKDMSKSDLNMNSPDGWVGLVQHYFVSAWVPQTGVNQHFYTKQLSESIFTIGSKQDLGEIAPGQTKTNSAKFYTGPQSHDALQKTAPGLEYTVDYGWLTFIAAPLFKLLALINDGVGNWGVAIILLTILIKLLFYPLSAAGYRNMAQMRELAPRLQSMKEKFGDDRQKMQQAMMELYKTEKINPFGGCMPILIQIPVFISLYWMLLGSVEMRHAPFMLWVQDLSAPDPYWILPLLMAVSMFVQTKLNPKPTDPLQAKMMLFMPIIFSVFFFFFPAGLVLYWLVNNILSIVQQAQINRSIHAQALAKKKGNVSR